MPESSTSHAASSGMRTENGTLAIMRSLLPHCFHWPLTALLSALLLVSAFTLTSMTGLLISDGQRLNASEQAPSIVATPWAVRAEAQILLRNIRARKAPLSDLFNQISEFSSQNAESLISETPLEESNTKQAILKPILQQIRSALMNAELAEDFADHHEAAAEEAWSIAQEDNDERKRFHEALRGIIHRYPFTQAEKKSWATLLNYSWDRGQLHQFILDSHASGFSTDSKWAQRVSAAQSLLEQTLREQKEIPRDLPAFASTWSVELPGQNNRDDRLQNFNRIAHFPGFAQLGSQLLFASDGRVLYRIDPFSGQQVFPRKRIGNKTIAGPQATALCDEHGACLLGLSGFTYSVFHFATDGDIEWEFPLESLSQQVLLSQIICTQDHVYICAHERVEDKLRLVLFSIKRSDGSLVFEKELMSLATQRFSRQAISNPDTSFFHGGILISNNNGLIILCDLNGELRQLWSHPTVDQVLERKAINTNTIEFQGRQARLLSDGSTALIAPAQHQHLFILDKPFGSLQRYEGQGASRPLLAMQNGKAYLGGDRLRAIEVASKQLLWEGPFLRRPAPKDRNNIPNSLIRSQVHFGGDNILLSHYKNVETIDTSNGSSVSNIELDENIQNIFAINDGFIIAEKSHIRGFVHLDRFFLRLKQALQKNPEDARLYTALASYYLSRGQEDAGIQSLITALRYGGAQILAQRAAILVRRRLQAKIYDDAFKQASEYLRQLAEFDEELKLEYQWWQVREAELTNNVELAKNLLPTQNSLEESLINFGNGIHSSLNYLIDAAKARLYQEPLPFSYQTEEITSDLSIQNWSIELDIRSEPICHDHQIFCYANGLLRSYDKRTGQEIWQQQPHPDDPPMLGIQMGMVPGDNGGVEVSRTLPGSSAKLAGIQDKDILRKFNETDINQFEDVSKTVGAMKIGDPFIVQIERDGEKLDINGFLGSWPEEPVQASEHAIISLRNAARGTGLSLSRQNTLNVSVFDPAGKGLLWRGMISNDQRIVPHACSSLPLVLIGNRDGLDAYRVENGKLAQAWSIPGQAHALNNFRINAPHWLSSYDLDDDRFLIYDLRNGQKTFSASIAHRSHVLIYQDDFYYQAPDGESVCWNIGGGRQIWKRNIDLQRPVYATDQLLYGLDFRSQLRVWTRRNGKIHRHYKQWLRVIDVEAGPEHLFAYISDLEQNEVLLALYSLGGSIAWEHRLPDTVTLQSPLQKDANGIRGIIGDEDYQHLVSFDGQGRIRQCVRLKADERIVPGSHGRLAYHEGGMRSLPISTPQSPGLLRSRPLLFGIEDWAEQLQAHHASAEGNSEDGSLELLHNNSLMIVSFPFINTQRQRLHLEAGAHVIAQKSQHIVIDPDGSSGLRRGDATWRLVDQMRWQRDGQEMVSLLIDLGPFVDFQVQLRMLLFQEENEENPWWYREAWQKVRFIR